MKNLLLLLITITTLFSSENYELELYQSVLPTLFQKKSLLVYTRERELVTMLQHSNVLEIANNCKNADLLIGKNFDDLSPECSHKPIFAASYRSFSNLKNAFGAFYWAKGRPQIHFKLKEIQRYHLHLSPQLQRYAK